MNCLQCGKNTTNPKFCSRTCAAKYNNRDKPKRTRKPKACKRCGSDITKKTYNSVICDTCKTNGDSTIEELTYKKGHRSSAFGHIRGQARTIVRKLGKTFCEYCGYSFHVEVAHINKIAGFPSNTPVSKVNDPSNLLVLCPNHHWEFDSGLLTIDVIIAGRSDGTLARLIT